MRFCVPDMACCLPSRDQSGQSQAGYIIDVEEILQDYVWSKFKATRPPWQQLCLRRKDFVVDVPMNYFHFDKIREEVRPRQRPLDPSLPTPQPSMVTQGMTHMPRDVSRNPLVANTNVMALSTDFTNCTAMEQTYRFRFEKTRKASLNVTFQKGFTIGGKVNFSLGLPKLASDSRVGGEGDMRVTVSKATGEIIEETLTWEATSEIKVDKTSDYSAKVLLSEAPVSYNFKLWTKMSMPSGGAPATVRRRRRHRPGKDNTSDTSPSNEFRYTLVIDNLKLVFQDYEGAVEFLKEPLGRETVTYSIVFKTSGIVDGVRLSDQKILLEQKELPSDRRNPAVPSSAPHPHPHYNPPLQGYYRHADVTEVTDGYHGDGYPPGSGSGSVPRPAPGRMLALGSSSSSPSSFQHPPPPPPIPIIEELPEDEGGMVVEVGQEGDYPSPPPRGTSSSTSAARATTSATSPVSGSGPPVPRITTTAPSSQASSPLSDTGSPDMSESSKKSETITTV